MGTTTPAATAARPYLSTAELADELGLARITIETWRQRGEGPSHIRLGRRVIYARADVDAWLAAHKVGGAA